MGRNRPKGGLLGGVDLLRVPDAPTISSITENSTELVVALTDPSDVGGGAITSYTALALEGSNLTTASSSTSTVTITGLTNGTSYSVTGKVTNAFGTSVPSAATSASPQAPTRAIWGGGSSATSPGEFIQYVTVETTGNATDFGDLTEARYNHASCSSSTRGIFAGGYGAPEQETIEYITIASTGNGTDFGDWGTESYRFYHCGGANDTRGLFAGGMSYQSGSSYRTTDINYITIASTGNTSTFGDLSAAKAYPGAVTNTTRYVIGGGTTDGGVGGNVNVMEYVTIGSTGNVTDFGDLTTQRYLHGSCGSSTRGLFGGGVIGTSSPPFPRTDSIDYMTIASTGNASDFGDLLTVNNGLSGCGSKIRGLFAGGFIGTGNSNVIQYVTIASTGNATDFGDLLAQVPSPMDNGVVSSNHGGLS
jgi:hypothetical protein